MMAEEKWVNLQPSSVTTGYTPVHRYGITGKCVIITGADKRGFTLSRVRTLVFI